MRAFFYDLVIKLYISLLHLRVFFCHFDVAKMLVLCTAVDCVLRRRNAVHKYADNYGPSSSACASASVHASISVGSVYCVLLHTYRCRLWLIKKIVVTQSHGASIALRMTEMSHLKTKMQTHQRQQQKNCSNIRRRVCAIATKACTHIYIGTYIYHKTIVNECECV